MFSVIGILLWLLMPKLEKRESEKILLDLLDMLKRYCYDAVRMCLIVGVMITGGSITRRLLKNTERKTILRLSRAIRHSGESRNTAISTDRIPAFAGMTKGMPV